MTDPGRADHEAIQSVVSTMENGWNTGDANAFASPFADDADFVTVYGFHAHGRETIAGGHDAIFKGIYKGSRVQYTITHARPLRSDVLLVHLHAHLSVPQGPLAGEHDGLPSLVLTREKTEWRIAAFHNTFISPRPGD